MSSAIAAPAPSLAGRARRLEKLKEELLSGTRHFAKTISISNEIDASLPWGGLPLGAIHQVGGQTLAAAIAFAALLAARIPSSGGPIVYAAAGRGLHPLGLLPYGVPADRWIHLTARRAEDLAWAVLEALRCPQVAAVLALPRSADLTLCRRFQLAAEQSGVTGFLLAGETAEAAGPSHSIASAVTRWRIAPLTAPPEAPFDEPCWGIDLSYCRGGRPGRWNMVWRNGRLEPLREMAGALPARPAARVESLPARRMAG